MVEIVRDRMLSAIVCCDIDPERTDCYDELDTQLSSIYNSTHNGWSERSKPIPCRDKPGRWHYVVIT